MWAAVETAEKTKDSRLARQLIVALPIELERDDWLLLLRGFIQMECVDKGMCADFATHDPDGHNPHAHIMVTMRPLDAHGKWQSKTQKEYLCRKADEECGFTAQEFLQAKEDGWEKQYKSRMFTAPLNSRTFPKAITKNSDKRPAAAFFTKAAAVVRMSILRIFRPNCRQNRRCRYSTRWNCCRP